MQWECNIVNEYELHAEIYFYSYNKQYRSLLILRGSTKEEVVSNILKEVYVGCFVILKPTSV